jgi:hypothetical protein
MTTYQEKIIKPRVGLLELAKELGNVSQACKIMVYSRDTFYRYKELHDEGGAEGLYEMNRKKPCIKNRVPEHVEDAIVNIAIEYPAYGQERAANELRKRGIIVSGGGVRSVWLRHDLEHFKKRLKCLETKIANDGIILTDAQLVALERIKKQNEAHGEIETEFAGYLGSQDTYMVANVKGMVVFTNRPLSTRIHGWHFVSYILKRQLLQLLITLMIEYYHFLKAKAFLC